MKQTGIEITITCPTDLPAVHFVDMISRQILHYMNHQRKQEISFALHEVLINAYEAVRGEYGEEGVFAPLTVTLCIEEEEITVFVADRAQGIGSSVIMDVQSKSFEDVVWEERSRGLLFIDHLVDEWGSSKDDKGAHVFMFKVRGR
ncbi:MULTISPECIES: ATP-binding protein [Aneurinibacillus]|uniref:Histidine kinase/HSP90-like ATPase domain-containing protein n=1 Tax=Aneurinibacillus danicus TaxID=267746 RepID=A0A511V8Y8_9BACL|nr:MULTISPECIES: ATP-binding protein [Aneurinibacillus]GEN35299.1 hypothetical protein ADA01nite_27590 [Aneurinibacillus danicus]